MRAVTDVQRAYRNIILRYAVRRPRKFKIARAIIMAKVFIDDSGSSSTEPLMYVAGWVGQGEVWDRFAADWGQALAAPNPKPIKYFKLNEAHALKGCFEGFSGPEALNKMMALVEVINRHEIYGVVYLVGRPLLRHMIDKHAITRGGRAHQNLEDPFFICLNSLIGYVLGAEYVGHPNDKVDFIFDGKPGGRQATRVIAMYEVTRDFMREPYRSVMGTAAAMDDKEAVPLQAADFLAGQVRAAIKLKDDPEPLATMRRHKFIHVSTVSKEVIEATISAHNFGVSTRRLLTIKRERDREKP